MKSELDKAIAERKILLDLIKDVYDSMCDNQHGAPSKDVTRRMMNVILRDRNEN